MAGVATVPAGAHTHRPRLLLAFLALGVLGLVVMMAGLAWDARMHTADPGLAEREGVFTLSNASHALSSIGTAMVAISIVGASVTAILERSVQVPRLAVAVLAGLLFVGFGAAGKSAMSAASGHSHHDMSQFPDPGAATNEQRAEAQRLLDRTRAMAGSAQFQTVGAARAAGYEWGLEDVRRPVKKEPVLLHGRNRAHYSDDRSLDPSRPESLVWWRTPSGELKLVAFMYRLPPGVAAPDYGGPIVRWHGHDKCKDPRSRKTLSEPVNGTCPDGQVLKDNPEMTHVWLTDDLRSAFAVEAPAEALTKALERAQ